MGLAIWNRRECPTAANNWTQQPLRPTEDIKGLAFQTSLGDRNEQTYTLIFYH